VRPAVVREAGDQKAQKVGRKKRPAVIATLAMREQASQINRWHVRLHDR